MTRTKTTKRALFASVLSLLLCVSMLIGSTFAWFTATASTSVNKIVSGKLDVALEMLVNDEWVPAEDKTLNFIAADGNEDILWEPGCTYELPKLRVVNNGNLALKFKVALTGIEGDAKLNEAIEWKTSWAVGEGAAMIGYEETMVVALMEKGDNMEFTLSGHMYEEAGNEYQDLTIDGVSITVYATQMTYESDSNNDQYDAGATLPKFYSVEGNLVAANEGQHIVGNGTTAILNAYQIYNNTVDNYVIASSIASQVKGDNTFNNCTFTDYLWFDDVADGTTVTFNNCTFKSGIKFGGNDTVKYVFNNCSFSGKVNWSKALITTYAPIELNDCSFDRSAGALYDVRLAQGMEIADVTANTDVVVFVFGGETFVVNADGATKAVVADVAENENLVYTGTKNEDNTYENVVIENTAIVTDAVVVLGRNDSTDAENDKNGGTDKLFNTNTTMNNVQIVDNEIHSWVTPNGSAAAWHFGTLVFGTAELNNCTITGTSINENSAFPNGTVVDLGIFNYSKADINGGEYGTVVAWSHTCVTVDGAKIDVLNANCRPTANAATANNKLTIKAGSEIGLIQMNTDGFVISNPYQPFAITIEAGAAVGTLDLTNADFISQHTDIEIAEGTVTAIIVGENTYTSVADFYTAYPDLAN